jgi:hypothetical protein
MEEKIQFDYIVIQRDGKDYIVRVLGEPSYKKIDLDPKEAYTPVYLPPGIKANDYPEIFENSKKQSIYPTPIRKVMCHIGKCDFCQNIVGSDAIRQEYTDIDNRLGYFYCNDCQIDFEDCMKISGTESIWYLRDRNNKETRYNIWVPRTRRDENGKRIKSGPYTFEKWRICGWYANDYEDENGVLKPHVVCENETLNKLIPVDFILELNPDNEPDYNPNYDPKWQ